MFPGRYLFPGFLAGAVVMIVPLVLHLLRRRRGEPVPLPSLFFLTPLVHSTRSHAWRRWLVLAMRCAAVLLLAIAFARPFRGQSNASGSATVVVVDRSFSMQTGERWTSLQTWAQQQLGPAEKGQVLGMLAMSNHPTWLVPMTGDVGAARRVLREMAPGWETARVEPALRLAGETLAASSARERRIVFMADHQRLSWAGTDFARKLPGGVNLVFAPPSPPPKIQAALVASAVTRDGAGRLTVEVSVHAFSASEQTRQLWVYLENAPLPVAQSSLLLTPQEERVVRLELPADPKARWVRLSLDADELPADDTAYAIVPEVSEHGSTVYLDARPISTDYDFAATALASAAAIPPRIGVAPLPASEWPRGGVAILRSGKSFAGGGGGLDAFLDSGGQAIVFVNAGIAASPWWKRHGITPAPLAAGAEAWRIHDWVIEHPLVAPLAEYDLRGLLAWEFRSGWSFARSELEPIGLWGNDTVAVGELRIGAGRLLICGFGADRRGGDWPIAAGFVPFLHRAVAELVGAAQHSARLPPQRVGEPLTLLPGRGLWRALAGPAANLPATEVDGAVVPGVPGIYAFERGAGASLFAVNVPAEESDLTPWTEGRPWKELEQAESPRAPASRFTQAPLAARESEEKNGWWWWGIAAVLLLALTELTVANRTTR